ncbi:TIM barrel protein [Microbacterium sp. NPDC055910]|uniref:TIM barrel protein n=1 Tax=Microbacterium sp. NPDC055910 TaxID=3345659 RepID=UPI0035D85C4B
MSDESSVSISTVSLAGTLQDKMRAAVAAGFGGVELLEYDLLVSPWSPRRVAEEAADLGLSIDVYQPLHVEAVRPGLFDARLRHAERKLDLVSELGARVLVCCSTTSDDGIDDDELAAEQLSRIADLAAQRGVRLALEAVPWGRVRTHEHAWRIVRRADHAALGMCLDSFHVLSHANDPQVELAAFDPAKIFHVQLADAPRVGMDVREWSLHSRVFPGQGVLDVHGFLEQLAVKRYRGSIALEVFNDVYQQEDPRHAAIDAMRSVRALAEAVGERGPAALRSASSTLPPAPRLDGYAFVEFAVDALSRPLLARLLGRLGFTHTGQHRSKPVELWEQGDARVLLDLAPDRSIDPATASIIALGVDTSDARASFRRAQSLLAPKLARKLGEGEADLNSVATPDGTALFFCEGDWLADFEPTGASASTSPLLHDIDHVSMTDSVDDFEPSTLFLRTVLGLSAGEPTEVNAPFGVVHRWTATDPAHRVRIALSTSPLRRGDWAPSISSPQSIAFRTDDVVACARALHDSGASILRIPGNYYDDLEARVGLPADMIAVLRENDIVYDRDRHGEYLHFFTEMVGSRVFFEIVQRIDGYDGFGDPHSVPLRMSAHRRQRMRMLEVTSSEVPTDHRYDYSLAHLTALSLTPPELVDAAAAAGYRYVGLRMTKVTAQEPNYPLSYDPKLMRATKTHLAAMGVEVLDIELARMTSSDSPRDYLRFLEAGAELGARHVITQLPDADFARKSDRFAELCELARPLGLTLDLEFPSWTETPNLSEAVRVLRAADQPNAGLLIDALHFWRSGSTLDELRALPREWFHYVHVCDAPGEIPTTTEGLIHTARFERLFPGEGDLDIAGILDALPPNLPLALEIPRATLVAQVGAKEHARLAIAASRRHLDAAAPSLAGG